MFVEVASAEEPLTRLLREKLDFRSPKLKLIMYTKLVPSIVVSAIRCLGLFLLLSAGWSPVAFAEGPEPTITAQTTGGTVLWGGSFTFSVAATGKPVLAYQWRKDGALLAGGSGVSWTVSAAKLADAGSYSVVVSNAAGNATSVSAKLVVNLPPPKNLFVATTGSDTLGLGSQAKPFATIQRAINAASPGDQVSVLAGTYSGVGNRDLTFGGKNLRLIGVDGPLKTLVDCGRAPIASLQNGDGPDPLIQGFTFYNAYKSDPYDWSSAALLSLKDSSATIENCVFRDNAADGTFWSGTTAAGLIFVSGGEPVFRNCLVYGNRFKSGDNATFAAVFAGHFKLIENCTVADNTLDAFMTDWWFFINKSLLRVFHTDATTKVVNCINWRNLISVIGERREIYPRAEAPEVPVTTYSLLDPLEVGLGNISADPRFNASALGDYTLVQGSPAIDAGDPASPKDANGTRADIGYRVVGVAGVPQAPVIVTQPFGGGVYYGDNFTFRVIATGDAPLTYQWRKNGVAVAAGSAFLSVTTVAGSAGTQGDLDGAGTSALFGGMQRMAVDVAGNVYMPDAYSNTIRKMTPAGVVSTVAGLSGISGSVDGVGIAARFNGPTGIAVDKSGNLYVADNANHIVRKITSGGSVTTIAGSAGLSGSVNGTGAVARFNRPTGLAVDGAGNVYVADELNHAIRKITPAGAVTTLAGSLGAVGAADGVGTVARFSFPNDVGLDKAGNLYVADNRNHAVRKVSGNGVVSTFAGALGVSGSVDGTGRAARFNRPSGISVDGSGVVYVADLSNQVVRKITAAGVVSTYAGKAGERGSLDGAATAALFSSPVGVAVDGSSNVYVSDGDNYTIRRIATDITRTGTSPAYAIYNAQAGNAGDYDVVVSNAVGVAVSTKVRLNVWDRNPVIVRQPMGGTVFVGGSYTLSVTATGLPELQYQWRKNGGNVTAGTFAEVGLKNLQVGDSGDYDVVVTNGVGSATSTKGTLNVVYPVPVITTHPIGNGTLTSGGSVTLSAVVNGGGTLSYQWYKDGLPLPNATSGSLALGEMKPWLIGDYTLKVSNQTGSVVSNAASLGMAGENAAIWKNLEAYYLLDGNPRDTSPFQIHGTARSGAAYGPDRRKSLAAVVSTHEIVSVPGSTIAFSKYETTVGQWKAFVSATGWNKSDAWRDPGFSQSDNHPVVNVSLDDALDYCSWLSQQTGRSFGLPMLWNSGPLRAGTYPYGDAYPPTSGDGNYGVVADGFEKTAPVGSFPPNRHGIYDAAGNVWEWTIEPWYAGDQAPFGTIGGAWSTTGATAMGYHNYRARSFRSADIGFRVVEADATNGHGTIGIPGTPVALSRFETTVGQWNAFVAATGWNKSAAWKTPGYLQGDDHPVVNLSWQDVQDYLGWMTAKTGKVCRLPSSAEWSAAAGSTLYPWGDDYPPGPKDGNYGVAADGYPNTAAIGSFKANPMGFYDLGGNVWEWVLDRGYPYDSSGPMTLRGGAWNEGQNIPVETLKTLREGSQNADFRSNWLGFRLAMEDPSHRYAIVPGVFGSFAAAKADAEARGGHLATITSAEEYAEVKRQLGGSLSTGVFLGAYKDSSNVAASAGWKWVTGEPFAYANWRGGEPNNYDGQERFVEIYTDWTWNDLGEKWFRGDGPGGYLIEFEGTRSGDQLGSLLSGAAGIALPDSGLLYKARTFSLWAKKDASASGQLLFHGDTRAGFDPLGFSVDEGGYVSFGSNMVGGFVVRSVAPIEPGRWVHVAGTVDDVSRQAVLYIDGRRDASGQASTSIEFQLDTKQDAGWGIGNHSGVTQITYDYPFKGAIDDVRFYNRALTATEIAQLYMYEAPSRMPIITVQPLSGTGDISGKYGFSATAVGDNLTYQWRKNGVNILGATLLSLMLDPLQGSDAGSYDVVVSNGFGSATSSAAILTISGVLNPPTPNPGGSPADYAIYVSTSGSDATGIGTLGNPFLTIGKAVSLAPGGARILVGAGTYAERVEFGGKTLRIHSLAGPMATKIQGAQGRSVVVIDGVNSELRGFRISGGSGEVFQNNGKSERFGGGVICRVNASITDCVVDGNGRWSGGVDNASSSYGGGIAVLGGNAWITNCLIVNNAVSGGGGAVFVQNGAMEMDRCTVSGNSSTLNAAGLAASVNGKVSVRNSIVFGNGTIQLGVVGAASMGAAFAVEYTDVSGSLTGGVAAWSVGAGNIATDPLFTDVAKLNFSLKSGSPAINAGNPRTPLDPDGTRADMGWRADRYNVETVLYVDKNGNDATGDGSQGRPYLTLGKAMALAPRGARILVGAGVYAERLDYGGKTLRIHSLFGADFTTIQGALGNAAVTIDAGAAYSELRGFRVSGGQGMLVDGKWYGGGIFAGATAYISDCVLIGNGLGRNQTETCSYGGAVYATGGAVTLANCLISNNLAWNNGGSVYVENGSVELDRCTVSGNNTAIADGPKGGLVVASGGKAEVRNSIVWGNGGGQFGVEAAPKNGDTELFVEYSDVQGGVLQLGATVFRNGFGNVSGDPLFADVTQGNFALLTGSPARDAAAPGLSLDEDGTAADMGWRAGRYANGVELYVSKSGSDITGTGSVAAPYLTIGKAISVAPAGAWIWVGSGTYAERLDYAGKTLGIRSLNGPASTVLQGAAGNTVVAIGTGAVNSRLQGFRITGGTGKPSPSSYGFDYYGGGVHCVTTAFISDCIIEGNGKGTPRQSSATFGGAIYSGGGKLTVSNCLITGNYAWASGGATLTESGSIEFDRCTVQGNDATQFFGQQGGLSVANGGQMVVKNSIVYGNTGSQLGAFGAPYNVKTSISVAYSDIQGVIDGGGTPSLIKGVGNIGAEPLFVNLVGRDFGLKAGSPAIDAADPLAAKDPDGTRADMGWRADRFYKGSVLRKLPVLKVMSAPVNGAKVLVPYDNNVVVVGGSLTHESGIDGVVFSWNLGSNKGQVNIDVNEVAPVVVGGQTQRTWEWMAEIPVEEFGKCDYSVFAVDQSNFKSLSVAGSFTVARGARVLVNVPVSEKGTLSVTPAVPADTLVEVGTTLQIAATAKLGYLFRVLEVDVDGLPEEDISRNNVSLGVTADTSITAQFIENPYPALAGQWTGIITDGWTSGLVSLTLSRTGGYSVRIISGRNSLSRTGVLDVSGSSLVTIPASFWPYSETKNSQGLTNSTARKPVSARVSLSNGGLKFEWGNGDPSVEGFGSADLSKVADATLVSSLTAKRYNSALWKDLKGVVIIGDGGEALRNWDKGAGFVSTDFSSTGIALLSGMARVAEKTVRYTFSGNVTAVRPVVGWLNAMTASGECIGIPIYGAPDGVCLRPYAVTTSSEIVLDGTLSFNRSQVSGPLFTRYVRTGALDPLPSVGKPYTLFGEPISAYDVEYGVNGYPYLAPKAGQVPLPFILPSKASFGVNFGMSKVGTLSLAGVRPFFRFGTAGPSGNWTTVGASMSVTTTNGAFSGSVLTQGTGSGGTGGATRVSHPFTGLLLQGGSQSAVGVSADGWPISFE